MDTHFAVLPLDVIDTVVSRLPDKTPCLPRFLRLPHPRTGIASLFLAHESDEPDGKRVSKILEVQAVEPPHARSWFMGDEVISDGKLLVMTPIDPLFLLVPILGAIKQPGGGVGTFRPAEDIFEDAARCMAEASMKQDTVDDIITLATLACVQGAMKRLCDVKEITPEITVFRYSPEKLMQALRDKVTMLSTPRITDMSRCLVRSLAKDGLMEDTHEDLLEQGRTKLACELLGQYLAQDIRDALLASYALGRLDAHVRALALPVPESGQPSAGKKRKREDKLKKANGMAKLSTFFRKK